MSLRAPVLHSMPSSSADASDAGTLAIYIAIHVQGALHLGNVNGYMRIFLQSLSLSA